ncbi:MAG: hypothetical protein AAGJ10_11470, partial [Bacteroidota bacterium]
MKTPLSESGANRDLSKLILALGHTFIEYAKALKAHKLIDDPARSFKQVPLDYISNQVLLDQLGVS